MLEDKVISFDFDGTLVDSASIKYDTFFEVADKFGLDKKKLAGLIENDFGNRYQIFQELTTNHVAASQSYSEVVQEKIATCQAITGSIELLKYLNAKGISIYVNSATPDSDLNTAIEARGLKKFFKGIFGSNSSKSENLKRMIDLEKISKEDLIHVGDALNDFEAASNTSCKFIAINSNGLFPEDLKNLDVKTFLGKLEEIYV